MAEIKRTRRNTLERRCLGKAFKRLFVRAPKGVFKMLEKGQARLIFRRRPAVSFLYNSASGKPRTRRFVVFFTTIMG